MLVHHVDRIGVVDLLPVGPQLLHAIAHAPLHAHPDELLGHEPPGAVLVVGQQLGDLFALFGVLDVGHHLLLHVLGQVGDHVGGIVAVQLVDHLLGDLLAGVGAQDGLALVLRKLQQHLGRQLLAQGIIQRVGLLGA